MKPVICYLEGSEAELKDDLDEFHVFVIGLHQVDEHHVVYPKQRDQQEGGLSQTSREHTDRYAEIHTYNSFRPKCFRQTITNQMHLLLAKCLFLSQVFNVKCSTLFFPSSKNVGNLVYFEYSFLEATNTKTLELEET